MIEYIRMATEPLIDEPRSRAEPRPLPANIRSVQPGGGTVHAIELAWGRLRRRYLKAIRPAYVRRMAALRRGEPSEGHDILDPRDLKFCRNIVDCRWDDADDPFRWREKIPFARWGLCELLLLSGLLSAATIGLALLPPPYGWTAIAPGVILALIVYFFRDPSRPIPEQPGIFVSPADGKLVEITELEHDDYIGGPSLRIGIFLSIFNVHINRIPTRSRVIELRYTPGKFLNALSPRSARENENMWIALEEVEPPHRRYIVRQISGAIARRIVCDLSPGEIVHPGHKFGMIKFGSRTELILPLADGLHIPANLGDSIKAGTTILARYPDP
jgi:phosphatidylserine decarboxylase